MKISSNIILGSCCIIIGIVSLLYFFLLFFTVVQSGYFYYIWIIIGLVSIIGGILLYKKKYMLLPLILRKIICTIVVIGTIVFVIVELMILSGFKDNTDVEMDYIIVLGALIKEDGPSLTLQMRLDAAIEYLELHPETIVIVSGGQGIDEPISEALGMQNYLIEEGINESQILMEDVSTSTYENLKFSSALINLETDYIGIVTSDFHVYRATKIAKKEGYENIYGIAANSHSVLLVNNLLREFLAVTKDFLVGNL